MCQADDGVTGEGSSPSALQMSDTADAEEEADGGAWFGSIGLLFCMASPFFAIKSTIAGILSLIVGMGMLTAWFWIWSATSKQEVRRQFEEARSADTATAEHSSVSLTQKGTDV